MSNVLPLMQTFRLHGLYVYGISVWTSRSIGISAVYFGWRVGTFYQSSNKFSSICDLVGFAWSLHAFSKLGI